MMRLRRAALFAALFLTILAGGPAAAQDEPTAHATEQLGVYAAPGQDSPIATLPAQATVIVEGRDITGTWLLVHTPDRETRGWVETRYLALDTDAPLASLSVIDEVTDADADRFNVYTGPGAAYPLVAALPDGVQLIVEGRDFAGTWLLVHTPNGDVRGWVEARHITLAAGLTPANLPVVSVLPTNDAPADNAITLRAGPGEARPVEATVPKGAQLVIEGRDESGDWLLVHTPDQMARGWASAGDVTLGAGVTVNDLAVLDEQANLESLPPPTIEVRNGPGADQSVSATVPYGMLLIVEGRDENGAWLRIHTDDESVHGWVAVGEITLGEGVTVAGLPVVSDAPPPAANPTSLAEPPPYHPTGASLDALVNRLYSVPVVPSAISARTRQIFQHGQQLGMRPDVFSKVGDCLTVHLAFMLPLGDNEYELGPYGYLQGTVDYFSVTSPRSGVPNSFVNASFAAATSFTAAAVLDPTWANPDYCQPGESPLACEYRVVRPSIAIILLGTMDVTVYGPEEFNTNMRRVVRETIDRGIVPVLTTFPSHPDRFWEPSLRFNNIILDIARDESIPVINLWLAARALPNYGLEEDNLHLSYKGERRLSIHGPDDRWISFSGDEQVWGHTLRNLVTLQALDVTRRGW